MPEIVRGAEDRVLPERFPDLELIDTRDPTMFFDSRDGDTVSASSPLQCWLELQTGNKRQCEAAGRDFESGSFRMKTNV